MKYLLLALLPLMVEAAPVVSVGTAQTKSYDGSTLTWTPSTQPQAGNVVVLPFSIENPLGTATPIVAITDNQSGNTYTIKVSQSQTPSGSSGGLLSGIIECSSLTTNGSLTFTLTVTGTGGRWTGQVNHIELVAGTQFDQSGVASASAASSGVVTASAQNTFSPDVVIAAIGAYIGSATGLALGDPPSNGYTSLGSISGLSGNATDTTTVSADFGYKITGSLETSSASWPGVWSVNANYAAVIGTFKPPSTPSGGGSQGLLTLGVALAPLAWAINRRNQLRPS